MATIITSNYQKLGAVFDSAQAAFDDKNSLFPEELTAAIQSANTHMLSENVITKPTELMWDSVTCTLSVIKHATGTVIEYYNQRAVDGAACVDYADQAGWTYLGDQVISP
jgi:hypothetical protein